MAVVPAGTVALRSTQAPADEPVMPSPSFCWFGLVAVDRLVWTGVQSVPLDVASRYA